ncbi:XkdF-like putative serine protease domain-containing protein [Hymenobacter sp. M29]|uniref:XkdF-like putative serine protease domain-containing protein n=1 Tax=Hymenobacter mellowenesis TaxID=3063995 RepID=A0ABT9AAN8_9BACT|nr:XkdF-like putative serine protease domain-containing protein [Hymenobacter sp. M29]MDO7846482.1 XkdF-like putative serine protease domain-containing protein [Hymenobacter sp. M29]
MSKAFLAPLSLALASLTAADLAAAPRYRMKMGENEPEQGVNLVSIVQNPAIGRGFVALSAVKMAPKRFHFSSEPTQQVLTGPALVPDEEILRLDAEGNPYYISFSAEQISLIKRRYALNGYQKLSNHEHATPLDGVVFEESWIVRDSERDPAAVLGLDVPAGTWMLSGYIADSDFWTKEVLTGNVTGFSIEGLFDLEEVTLAAVPAPTPSKMKKPWNFSLMAAVAKLAGVKFTKTPLKDGTVVDVAEDGSVSDLDADGNVSGPAKDGAYELEDGTTLTVKDGKKVDAPKEDPKLADEAVAAAQEVLKGITADTSAADAKSIIEKALEALGVKPAAEKTPEEVKAAAVELFLEAVPMAGDLGNFNYNPITRMLTKEDGTMVMTGVYACADGSYFEVSTSQYTYQIDAATYAKAQKLSAVEVQLAAAQLELSKTPDGGRVHLSGAGANTPPTPDAPANWVTLALARAKELTTEPTE